MFNMHAVIYGAKPGMDSQIVHNSLQWQTHHELSKFRSMSEEKENCSKKYAGWNHTTSLTDVQGRHVLTDLTWYAPCRQLDESELSIHIFY